MSNLKKSEAKIDVAGFSVKGARFLVECEQDSNTYNNSIILKAEKYKRFARSGWVAQVGDGVEKKILEENNLGAGDKVFFDAYSGLDVELNGNNGGKKNS